MSLESKLEELQNIDWEDFSQWPIFIKLIGIGVICLVILGAGYWFVIKGELENYAHAKNQEEQLRQDYTNKKASAINLPAYKQQMADMQQTFGSLLRQLPDKTEVPSLLVDITQAGLGQGLVFKTFKPSPPQNKGFYAVLPINIEVSGNYHQLAGFVSDVAALPRIVTVDGIAIDKKQSARRAVAKGKNNQQAKADDGQLTMKAMAYTYRYLTAEEQARARAAEAPARGKPRRRTAPQQRKH